MTIDITDANEEPPDINPRALNYHANGMSGSWRVWRVEEAEVEHNNLTRKFLRRIGEDKYFERIGPEEYSCIDCKIPATRQLISRDVKFEDYSNKSQLQVQVGFYCSLCETAPARELPSITKNNLDKMMQEYREAQRKSQ